MSEEAGAKDLGGLQIPPAGSATAGNLPPAADATASAAHIRQRKTRSDAGQPRGARGGKSSEGVQALSQTQFAQLYSPEIWSKALAAPADAMAAITGRKHWLLAEKERDALGVTGSVAAQCFAVSDPKYLALSLCLITILDVYGIRLAMDFAERKREAEEKKKAAAKQ